MSDPHQPGTDDVTVESRFRQELRALFSAPLVSGLALVTALAIIWAALHFAYRGALSTRDRYIAALERRVADYRDKLGGASADEAKARIEALEAEIRTLRIRLQPRRLSGPQRLAIADRSRLPAGASPYPIAVVHQEPCSDCAAFASELAEALRESGSWTVTTRQIAEAPGSIRHGLAIRVAEPLRRPPSAAVLQRAIQAAGMPVEVIAGAAGQEVELLVVERLAP